jgi:TolB-like protein
MKIINCSLLLVILLSLPLAAQDYTLGVLYFDTPGNSSGIIKQEDREALSLALTEMMISDLSRLQILTLVDRENLNKIMEEQTLSLTGLLDESTTARTGELLGAQYLMTGSLLFTADNIILSSRISRVETGEVMASVTLNGQAEQIFPLQEELLEELMTQWDIPLSRKEWNLLAERSNVPLNGLIQLGNALEASDKGDYQAALTYLESAMELSPDFTLAADLLSEIKARFDRFLTSRDKELPLEIIARVDDLAAGVQNAENDFSKMYWAYLQPLMMGNSYYGSVMSIEPGYRKEYFNYYIKKQWNQMGLTEEPESIEEMERILGEKLYKAYGIMEYLLDKNLPMEGYSTYLHPVEGALGYFLTLFAAISSSPDWAFPPMIDPQGNRVMTKEQYYPLLLSYCDMFLTNFPYSTYNGMVTPMMHTLISLVEEKSQN